MLNPLKAIYWIERSTLLISDLHLGKAGHFRKAGIPIPGDVHADDYQRLMTLYNHYKPKKILILGDLFHSDFNREWHDFIYLKKLMADTSIELVPGNHDILPENEYEDILLHPIRFKVSPFIFSHKPLNTASFDGYYNICGHIHPSIKVKIGLRQSVRLNCFYFSSKTGILPAFGKFTGNYKMKIKVGDRVFAIAEHRVMEIKN